MSHATPDDVTRRDFLYIASVSALGVGAAATAWPLINQMNPTAATAALATTEVDLSGVPAGQMITVMWRKQPVFIRHRTEKEIADAQAVALTELKDPEADAARVFKPEWLIVIGICTHLGCIPPDPAKSTYGEYGGWLCPCHGSQYDTSGRIRVGPAPTNLAVPNYEFVSDTKIVIGEGKTPEQVYAEKASA